MTEPRVVAAVHCEGCHVHRICPGIEAVSRADWEAMRDLLARYREAHRSMALVAQEAGASEAYRQVTKEVDDALDT